MQRVFPTAELFGGVIMHAAITAARSDCGRQ